jgi:excisionase family DNA binding protein
MEPEYPDDLQFYSVREVAKMLEVSAETVKRWIRGENPNERLSAVKLGNHWRVSKEDLREFLAERRA